MTQAGTELIKVGKITGTHGIKGEVKFYPYSGSCDSIRPLTDVLLISPSGLKQTVKIQRVKSGGGKHIIGLVGYDSINLIKSFIGYELSLYRSQLPEPEENEYYWCDLMGLNVVTDSGQPLGSIIDIFETGSNDIYVVNNGNHEYLIPAIEDVISSIDLKSRLLTITPIDGLLDL